MRCKLSFACVLAVVVCLAGCQTFPWLRDGEPRAEKTAKKSSPTKSDGEKDDTAKRNTSLESENWAAKARPRSQNAPPPYFYNDQARQIEKNLGL